MPLGSFCQFWSVNRVGSLPQADALAPKRSIGGSGAPASVVQADCGDSCHPFWWFLTFAEEQSTAIGVSFALYLLCCAMHLLSRRRQFRTSPFGRVTTRITGFTALEVLLPLAQCASARDRVLDWSPARRGTRRKPSCVKRISLYYRFWLWLFIVFGLPCRVWAARDCI